MWAGGRPANGVGGPLDDQLVTFLADAAEGAVRVDEREPVEAAFMRCSGETRLTITCRLSSPTTAASRPTTIRAARGTGGRSPSAGGACCRLARTSRAGEIR